MAMRTSNIAVWTAAVTLALWPGAVAHAQSPCGQLDGVVRDGGCQIHAATSAYSINASFPIDYPDPQPMIDYLKETRDGFINVSQMPGSRGLPYELDIKAQAYR